MNILIFGDKNNLEILPYKVDFHDRLLFSEAITSPFVTIQVFSGVDSSPSAMLDGSPTTDGTSISFTLRDGQPGNIYLVIVSALISSGNLYIKVGHLAVIASDPFASS